MSEQICSFVISIIGNHESFALLLITSLIRIEMVVHDELEDLGSLATWSSTHVKD